VTPDYFCVIRKASTYLTLAGYSIQNQGVPSLISYGGPLYSILLPQFVDGYSDASDAVCMQRSVY